MMTAYLIALAVILTVSALLIMWCHYDDGLIGKSALIVTFFGSAIPFYEVLSGIEMHVLPTTVLLACGFALFLVRHLYRFVRWRLSGTFEWRRLLG